MGVILIIPFGDYYRTVLLSLITTECGTFKIFPSSWLFASFDALLVLPRSHHGSIKKRVAHVINSLLIEQKAFKRSEYDCYERNAINSQNWPLYNGTMGSMAVTRIHEIEPVGSKTGNI